MSDINYNPLSNSSTVLDDPIFVQIETPKVSNFDQTIKPIFKTVVTTVSVALMMFSALINIPTNVITASAASVLANVGTTPTAITATVGPGGINPATSQLKAWFKGDVSGCTVGSACPAWKDSSPSNNPIETTGNLILKAGDVGHNFQPWFSGFSEAGANYFHDTASSINSGNVYTVTPSTVFAVAKQTNAKVTGRIIGIDNDNSYGGEYNISTIYDSTTKRTRQGHYNYLFL